MKSFLKKDKLLVLLALLGLLASLVPIVNRVQTEESNKYYDIVLDYNSMRSMARQSSQSEDEWLDLFKSLGVDKVALSEASALNLHDNAAIPALRDRGGCTLANHGVLAVGKDLAQAYLRAEYIEDVARIYTYAKSIGTPVTLDTL